MGVTVAIGCFAALLFVMLLLHDREAKAWTAERQTLLERIQRPERIPAQTPSEPKEPLETDELALVGRIEEE